MLDAALPGGLRERVLGVLEADLEQASAEDVLRAVAPSSSVPSAPRERAFIARTDEALGTGGPGLDEVLSTLEQQRVEALLVLAGEDLGAGLCPRCGRLFASADGACRADGSPLAAVEHAAELTVRQSAQVVVVRHEATWLRERGAIAAPLPSQGGGWGRPMGHLIVMDLRRQMGVADATAIASGSSWAWWPRS